MLWPLIFCYSIRHHANKVAVEAIALNRGNLIFKKGTYKNVYVQECTRIEIDWRSLVLHHTGSKELQWTVGFINRSCQSGIETVWFSNRTTIHLDVMESNCTHYTFKSSEVVPTRVLQTILRHLGRYLVFVWSRLWNVGINYLLIAAFVQWILLRKYWLYDT